MDSEVWIVTCDALAETASPSDPEVVNALMLCLQNQSEASGLCQDTGNIEIEHANGNGTTEHKCAAFRAAERHTK